MTISESGIEKRDMDARFSGVLVNKMIEKCANPICSAEFRRFRHGKVFAFEPRGSASISAAGPNSSKTIFFWLCDTCSLDYRLAMDAAGNPKVERILPTLRLPERPFRNDVGLGEIA
jgi:hypothetical protein